MFKRMMIFTYGVVAYLTFFAAILYAMGFVANVIVPKGINDGAPGNWMEALIVNSLLLGAFAVQHTIMARKGFKRWVTQYIPAAVERSTFVLVASVLLLVAFWQWRPMPDAVWSVPCRTGSLFFEVLSWMGWGLVFLATFLINHFDLFGLRQVWLAMRQQAYRPLSFRTTMLYKLVRHPLLLGFLIAFWSAPVMTEGRLLFAVLTTAYILVGIQFEERDLAEVHGDTYREYQEKVPMLIPYKKPVTIEDSRPAYATK
jgi:protein-S-isoprenylcysteine O-methyltransferase Ste14